MIDRENGAFEFYVFVAVDFGGAEQVKKVR
jgi:hypothetical protein